uniref:Putative conserved secreted protein n=1 Tax=Rhipicephalus microplus TaxID=6941 RepID=A0A6M2CIQ3_RHIMP
MKHILAIICAVSLVAFAANAQRRPADESRLDETFKDVERDAAHIGEIHREVIRTLTENEKLEARSEENIFQDLWDTTTEAVTNGVKKITGSIVGAVANATNSVKKITGSIVGAVVNATNSVTQAVTDVYQKIKDKAVETMSKIVSFFTSIFTGQDPETTTIFTEVPSDSNQQAAQLPMNVAQRGETPYS